MKRGDSDHESLIDAVQNGAEVDWVNAHEALIRAHIADEIEAEAPAAPENLAGLDNVSRMLRRDGWFAAARVARGGTDAD